MTANAAAVENIPRYAIYLTSFICSDIRRNYSAAALACLCYQHGLRQTDDDAVARRKIGRCRRNSRRIFRHQCALLGNAGKQLGVFGRIDNIQTAAKHCHRRPSGLQAGLVRRRINALGTAADDGYALTRHSLRKAGSSTHTVFRAAT